VNVRVFVRRQRVRRLRPALRRDSAQMLLYTVLTPALFALSLRVAQPARISVPPSAAHRALNVRIDGVWRDLTGWRAAHPAGTHWIDGYADADATEVMTQAV